MGWDRVRLVLHEHDLRGWKKTIVCCRRELQFIPIRSALKYEVKAHLRSAFRAEVQDPFRAASSCHVSLEPPVADGVQKSNTPIKLDFPDPFGPITTLIGLNSSFSTEAMLLNPWIVIESSAFLDIRFLNHHTIVPPTNQILSQRACRPWVSPG